jgi:hypothetical protein
MSMLRRPTVNIGPSATYNEEGRMPIIATKDEYREDAQGIRRKISKGTVVSRALFPDYEGDDVATRDVHVSSVDPDANGPESTLPVDRSSATLVDPNAGSTEAEKTGSGSRKRSGSSGSSGSGSGSGSGS